MMPGELSRLITLGGSHGTTFLDLSCPGFRSPIDPLASAREGYTGFRPVLNPRRPR